jgi:ABC-2 type transport system permease protein
LSWRGEMSKFLSATYKNWIVSRRNVFTLFELVFWPFIGLLSIGLLTRFLQIEENMVAFVLVGAIALSILQISQIDVAYILLFDMWSKSIKQTFVSPVRGYHLVIGALLFGVIRGSFVFLILVIASSRFFGFDFLAGGVGTVVVFLGGIFMTAAVIGMVVCISILTFGQRADVAAWTLSGIMMLVSGIYYPVDILPSSLQAIARLIPLTYFLEYYRSAYGYGSHNVLFGAGLAVFYFLAGLLILNMAIDRARRTGMLLRLSE